jgi:hypothetical protein
LELDIFAGILASHEATQRGKNHTAALFSQTLCHEEWTEKKNEGLEEEGNDGVDAQGAAAKKWAPLVLQEPDSHHLRVLFIRNAPSFCLSPNVGTQIATRPREKAFQNDFAPDSLGSNGPKQPRYGEDRGPELWLHSQLRKTGRN